MSHQPSKSNDELIDEFWKKLRKHVMWKESASGLVEDRITELFLEALQAKDTEIEKAVEEERERIEEIFKKAVLAFLFP